MKFTTLKDKVRPKRGTGPRVYGKAGASARAHTTKGLRTELAAKVTTKHTLIGAVVVALFAASLTYQAGHNPALAVGAVAAAWTLVELALRKRGVVASLVALTVYTVMGFFVAPIYAVSRSPLYDPMSAHYFLIVLGVLVVLAAHRFTNRGRPWVTTAFTLAAILTAGPALIVVFPPIGMVAAYVAAAVVILWRAGVRDLVADTWDRAVDKFEARRRGEMPATASQDARWDKGASGEEATAEILSGLDNAWSVFHDLAVPGTNANIDHVVIGPSGVFVIDSKNYSGTITEHPKFGLQAGNRPLAQTFHTAVWEARETGKILNLDEGHLSTLVVVHGAELPRSRATVAIFDVNQSATDAIGHVTVLSPDELHNELAGMGVEVLSARDVKRLTGRARRRFTQATDERRSPVDPARESALPKAAQPLASVMDADGNVTSPVTDVEDILLDDDARLVEDSVVEVDPDVMEITAGTPIVITSEGREYAGYRAVTAPTEEPQYGLVIWATPGTEYDAACVEQRPAKAQPYRVETIRRAVIADDRP